MSRRLFITALILTVVATWAAPAAADDTAAAKAHEGVPAKQAVLSSAALAEDPGLMKGLAKALSEDKGILAAKFDDEKSVLRVTFDPEATSAEAIHKALSRQLSDITVQEVVDTTWEPKDCGKCPHAAKCAKEKEGGPPQG